MVKGKINSIKQTPTAVLPLPLRISPAPPRPTRSKAGPSNKLNCCHKAPSALSGLLRTPTPNKNLLWRELSASIMRGSGWQKTSSIWWYRSAHLGQIPQMQKYRRLLRRGTCHSQKRQCLKQGLYHFDGVLSQWHPLWFTVVPIEQGLHLERASHHHPLHPRRTQEHPHDWGLPPRRENWKRFGRRRQSFQIMRFRFMFKQIHRFQKHQQSIVQQH